MINAIRALRQELEQLKAAAEQVPAKPTVTLRIDVAPSDRVLADGMRRGLYSETERVLTERVVKRAAK
jgi:hypothetical protein